MYVCVITKKRARAPLSQWRTNQRVNPTMGGGVAVVVPRRRRHHHQRAHDNHQRGLSSYSLVLIVAATTVVGGAAAASADADASLPLPQQVGCRWTGCVLFKPGCHRSTNAAAAAAKGAVGAAGVPEARESRSCGFMRGVNTMCCSRADEAAARWEEGARWAEAGGVIVVHHSPHYS